MSSINNLPSQPGGGSDRANQSERPDLDIVDMDARVAKMITRIRDVYIGIYQDLDALRRAGLKEINHNPETNPAEKERERQAFQIAFAKMFPSYLQQSALRQASSRATRMPMPDPVPMTGKEMQEKIRIRFMGEPECFSNPLDAPPKTRDRIYKELLKLFEMCLISYHRQDVQTFKAVWKNMFPDAATADLDVITSIAGLPQPPPAGDVATPSRTTQEARAPPIAIVSPEEMEQLIRREFPDGNLQIDPEAIEAIRARLAQKFTSPQEKELFQQIWQGLFAASAATTTSAPPPPPLSAAQTVGAPPKAVGAPPQHNSDESDPEFTASAATPPVPQITVTATEKRETMWEEGFSTWKPPRKREHDAGTAPAPKRKKKNGSSDKSILIEKHRLNP